LRTQRRYLPLLASLEPRRLLSALDPTEPVVPPTGPDFGDPGLSPPPIVTPLPAPIGPRIGP
jgi:hypothetical protein